MNTTASFLPEPSWSRRCSTETVFSIQGRETDIVQDSSDSEWGSDDELEYEPVSCSDEEAPISGATSGQSDAELTKTVVVVPGPAADDGDELADSERSGASDCERDLPQYSRCARCHENNGNKRFRYCDKCFKLRKNFFPPRPRRKPKQESLSQESLPSGFSQDSGIGSLDSQELASSQDVFSQGSSSQDLSQGSQGSSGSQDSGAGARLGKLKRRSESADRAHKRPRLLSGSSADEPAVAPLVKTASDPAVTVESLEAGGGLCIICLAEPKSGVFVHRRVAHICCCYPCAVKVWSKARRCPICNCKVSNVLKAIVM